MINTSKIERICSTILEGGRSDDFCGYDPFDALNSTIFQRSGLNSSKFARIAWLQFNKRSPVNFRNLVGIEKRRNPKGIALFILGLVERFKMNRSIEYLELANNLARWLVSEAVDRDLWKHYGWGYHFDWAARAFYVPRGKPNAITTCYVARALRALGTLNGNTELIDIADDAGYFLDSLYTENSGIEFYAYIPGETAFVHNASLWTAAVVLQTAGSVGDENLKGRALRVARQSIMAQSEDGSWPYGSRAHHSFIDGFHTGYNLEALKEIQAVSACEYVQRSIEKGIAFYRANFFMPDGTVKYYHDSPWPLDTHSVAQALLTLIKVGGTADDFLMIKKVINKSIETLYLHDKGRFIYQAGRIVRNKINYLRWTQAWAFYALSVYLHELQSRSEIE